MKNWVISEPFMESGKSQYDLYINGGKLRFLWVGDKQYICHRHSSFKPSDKYKYQMV